MLGWVLLGNMTQHPDPKRLDLTGYKSREYILFLEFFFEGVIYSVIIENILFEDDNNINILYIFNSTQIFLYLKINYY